MDERVKSPCINVCRMDPVKGLCEGCLRSLDEIARWAQTTNDDRRQILAWVEKRKATFGDPWNDALRGDCE